MLTVTPSILKKKLKFCEIQNEDKWRARMIREVTDIRQNVLTLDGDGFTDDEFDTVIEFLSTT